MRQPILIIVGPTASGKSALAVELARRFNGEIISADSRQVYRGLDIGTGKVTKREMRGVRHHLLDVASPRRVFTAKEFSIRARHALEEISKRGKLPIVCGGTGFYIDILLGRAAFADVPPNPTLRARLSKKTTEQLFALLQKRDPVRAASIDRHNPVRLIRALEIIDILGTVPRAKDTAAKNYLPCNALWIGIKPEKEQLAAKIRVRLTARLRRGMIAEARRLHQNGLSWKRLEAFGLEYRSLARFLRGTLTKEAMIAGLERDIRTYAKRQMTYWRRNKEIHWLAPESRDIQSLISNWLQK